MSQPSHSKHESSNEFAVVPDFENTTLDSIISNTERYPNYEEDAAFTVCCPCKFCYSCSTISCLSCKDCCNIICCRMCFPPPKPTWNRKFELIARVTHHILFTLGRKPNYRVARLIADMKAPQWLLSNLIKGVKFTSGNNLDGDMNLPGYDFIFPVTHGPPLFHAGDKRNYILYFHYV